MTRRLIVAACLMCGLLTPGVAESATLLQWMFPRAAARRAAARTAYSPWTTTYYSPTACNTCNRTTAFYGGGCSTCSSQQTGWFYRPQTQYRTVWSQVPVTTYRPVTTAYAAAQPCTSYSWQARRVPYVTYRPMFAGVRNSCSTGCQNPIVPNAGTYWTQFGSAGFRLPTTKGPAPCSSCTAATGFSTPADVAPVLTPPATTSYSIPTSQTTYPTTTAGYPSAWTPVESSQTTVQMPNSSNWQTVPSTSGYAPSSDAYSYSNGSTSSQSDVPGATPWMPADEFKREFKSDTNQLQPVPADRRPQLEDPGSGRRDRDSYYERNTDGSRDEDARWRSYNQYGDYQRSPGNRDYRSGPTSGVDLDRYLSLPSQSENRNAPSVRAIPDYDRREFESKTHSKQPRVIDLPEITASLDNAAAGRWVAEPLRPVARDHRTTQVQRPTVEAETLHREGGWRSVH